MTDDEKQKQKQLFDSIQGEIKKSYNSKGKLGVKQLLLNPSSNPVFSGRPTEFLKDYEHFSALNNALDTYGYEPWIGPASAVVAVCVPNYKGHLFAAQLSNGQLQPVDSDASEILLA